MKGLGRLSIIIPFELFDGDNNRKAVVGNASKSQVTISVGAVSHDRVHHDRENDEQKTCKAARGRELMTTVDDGCNEKKRKQQQRSERPQKDQESEKVSEVSESRLVRVTEDADQGRKKEW